MNNPAFSGEIKQDVLAIPSISLSMSWNDWFNPDGSGLYISPASDPGTNHPEHQTSFEIINPDGTKGVNTTNRPVMNAEFEVVVRSSPSFWNQ